MPTFKPTLLAATIALGIATSGTSSAQFNNIYFFGDSLTDAGYFGGARFTINPGLVWSQDLGNAFGFTITPSNAGGTNYAQGGARVALPGNVVPGFAQRPLGVQIDEVLKATPNLNPNALYAVWIGANDVRASLAAASTGAISSGAAGANVVLAATQTAAQLARLASAGARYIVVLNLPDLGKTPEAIASGPAAVAGGSQLASTYNTALNAAVNSLGFSVIQVNLFPVLSEVAANPSAYGFANVTGFACTTSSALTCTTSTLVSPSAATGYLFADSIHPSPAGHVVLAQIVNSMITGPQQVAALGEAPFASEQANFRAVDTRMWSSFNTTRAQKKVDAWAAYDYGNVDTSAANGNAKTNTITVGADAKVSDNLLVGAMFGYTENKGDFGGAGGGFTLKQPVGTVYAGYGEGPWYVGGTIGVGGLDYSDVNRNITLGALVRNESGETRGTEYTGRVLGGYWFKLNDVLHGPYGRVTYTKTVVNAYSERGADSTALIFGGQKVRQLLWSAGWQVAGNVGNVRPFARVTWEYDSMDQNRSVDASSVSLGGNYSIPVAKPDNSYALFNVGASADFGGVTGFVSGSGTAARSGANYWAATVGIRMPI